MLVGRRITVSAAGSINGKEVPLSAFDQQVNAERQKLQENRGEVPPYQYHMVPRQVWEQQVQRVLNSRISLINFKLVLLLMKYLNILKTIPYLALILLPNFSDKWSI